MSEYQYFEFLAVDRPLTAKQQKQLRAVSTRGQISSSGFVNEYEWGDLRADPRVWMESYFDAHLYLADWGTRRIALRLPVSALDPATVTRYCLGGAAQSWTTDTHVFLDLHSAVEDEDVDDGEPADGRLTSIIPVRAELASGDMRPLYLAWLLAVQGGELHASDIEPPVPARLGRLSEPQRELADFLRLEPGLLKAAGKGSESADARTVGELLKAGKQI